MSKHSAQSDNKTKTETPKKLKNVNPAEKSKNSKTIEKTENIKYTEKEQQSKSTVRRDNILKSSLSTYTTTSRTILKQRSITKYTTSIFRHQNYHTPLPLDNTTSVCPDTPRKTQNANTIDKVKLPAIRLDFSDDSSTGAHSLKEQIGLPNTVPLKQRKITEYFNQHMKARQAPSTKSTAQPQPITTCKPQAKNRFKTTKAAIRSRLLHYHPPQLMQKKITSFTAPIPTSELYDSWGHSLEIIDPTTTFRLFLQNPNGLSISWQNFSLQQDLKTCNDYGAAVICMPETNTNWDLPQQRECFTQMLHRTWKTTVYQTSRAPESFLSSYQPGGTATITCDNWVSRLVDRGADPMGLGRWSFVTLRGKGVAKITIITAYNPSPTQGDTTNFQQQQRLLSQLHRHHNQNVAPHPHRQLILDLQSWIEHLIKEGHEIILTIDANETYNPDICGNHHPLQYSSGIPTLARSHDGKFSTLVTTCGLKDPLALQHSSRPFPASHIRGSQRIDFILVTPNLLPAVQRTGSLSYYSLMQSDHRAYYVDFDSIELFSDPAYDIAPPMQRLFMESQI